MIFLLINSVVRCKINNELYGERQMYDRDYVKSLELEIELDTTNRFQSWEVPSPNASNDGVAEQRCDDARRDDCLLR